MKTELEIILTGKLIRSKINMGKVGKNKLIKSWATWKVHKWEVNLTLNIDLEYNILILIIIFKNPYQSKFSS